MATIPVVTFIPILFFGIVTVIIAMVILNSARQMKYKKRGSQNQNPNINPSHAHVHYQYVPGQFSPQMELDMRLPYRRFKKLYPHSNITYEEYKRMQMQAAFRRSMSSQDNKRMVR